MTRTFLVDIEIGTELAMDVAGDLEHLLSRDYDVISVKPWASPGTTPLLEQQETTTQQQ